MSVVSFTDQTVWIGSIYYLHSKFRRLELSFTGTTVFFNVDLTGSFCCDFDKKKFGRPIATECGSFPSLKF